MMDKFTTRLYDRWRGILRRCYDVNRKDYKYYGGKGVQVGIEWHSFGPFYLWYVNYMDYCRSLGMDDVDKLVVDRIDSSKDYYPGNCRLITARDNALRAIKNRDSKGRFARA